MTNPRNYIVFAGGKYACEQQSLVAASISAREGAASNPGVKYHAERDGTTELRYELVKGVMKAWVR
jgi:hypothetical protein